MTEASDPIAAWYIGLIDADANLAASGIGPHNRTPD